MNKQKFLSILLGLTFIIIFFLPILKSGLYSDDLFNFEHKTIYTATHNLSVYQLAVPNINYWKTIGRYTPISFFWMEFVYKYFTAVESYKLLVFVMNILAVIIFLIYLLSLKFKINYGIWIVCLGAVVQFRISYHDAYTSLNGMYQLVAIFIFGALIFYSYYILYEKLWLLILSVLIFLTGILVSEIGLTTLFLLPVSAIILKVPAKKFIGNFFLFILISIIYLSYTFWLRMNVNASDAYIGLTTNFDFVSMRNLLYKQLFATLPLSNLHDKFSVKVILWHQLHDLKNFISIVLLFLVTFLIHRNYKNQKSSELNSINWGFFLLSVTLIICPVFFILPSLKYQQEVKWGIAYLPVYIQNFGIATLFSCLIQLCFNSRFKFFQFFSNFIFIILFFCSCITLLFNNALINSHSYNTSFPAQILYQEVKNGILQNCKNGSTIIIGNNFFWKQPNNYGLIFKDITGKDFKVFDTETPINTDDSNDCFLLDCQPGKKVFVKLTKINCADKKPIALIKEVETDYDIEIIEEEKNISYY